MKKRLLLAIGLLGAPLAIANACSFPDVTFAPDGPDGTSPSFDAPSGATSDSPASQESGSPGDTGGPGPSDGGSLDADASVDADADAVVTPPIIDGSPDALVATDTDSGKVDTTGCTTCDCDHDTFDNDGGSCGTPYDCDDSDSRVNVLSGYRYDDASAPWNGDWNCNNTLEKLYPENVTCTNLVMATLALQGTSCDKIQGFSVPIACGQYGSITVCKNGVLNCVVDTSKSGGLVRQACR
jgi:hypothetical protein